MGASCLAPAFIAKTPFSVSAFDETANSNAFPSRATAYSRTLPNVLSWPDIKSRTTKSVPYSFRVTPGRAGGAASLDSLAYAIQSPPFEGT